MKRVAKRKTSPSGKRSAAQKTRPVLPHEEKLPAGNDATASLCLLERIWPPPVPAEVVDAFSRIRAALKSLPGDREKKEAAPAIQPKVLSGRPPKARFFDSLESIRQVLAAQDMLFLSRQVSYHIAASSELPRIFADEDQVRLAFSMLIEQLIRTADRGSRLDIELKEFTLHTGRGIEISLCITSHSLEDATPETLLENLLRTPDKKTPGSELANSRHFILQQHGQLWLDIPKQSTLIYHVTLPSTEIQARQPAPATRTFKYDISISNFPNVRKRFGIKKSISLVSQIERYIRSLVRYPIDMVMAIGNKGVITTIYETPKGAEQSVASRISQRLGSEAFHIGKRPVDLAFRYQLTPLHTVVTGNESDKSQKG